MPAKLNTGVRWNTEDWKFLYRSFSMRLVRGRTACDEIRNARSWVGWIDHSDRLEIKLGARQLLVDSVAISDQVRQPIKRLCLRARVGVQSVFLCLSFRVRVWSVTLYWPPRPNRRSIDSLISCLRRPSWHLVLH